MEYYKLENHICSPLSSVLWLCKLSSAISPSWLLASFLLVFSICIFLKNDVITDTFQICILTVILTELSIKHPLSFFVRKVRQNNIHCFYVLLLEIYFFVVTNWSLIAQKATMMEGMTGKNWIWISNQMQRQQLCCCFINKILYHCYHCNSCSLTLKVTHFL